MGGILYDLSENLRVHLQSKMITSIPVPIQTLLSYTASDSTVKVMKPGLIKVGRYQDDPTDLGATPIEPSVLVAVHFSDPDGDWMHSVASAIGDATTNAGFGLPGVYEIGGSTTWWRRLEVQSSVFCPGTQLTQSVVSRLASAFFSYLGLCCDWYSPDTNIYGWNCALTDSFGETASRSVVVKVKASESGGPPNDYIWRGRLWLQVLTHKEGLQS